MSSSPITKGHNDLNSRLASGNLTQDTNERFFSVNKSASSLAQLPDSDDLSTLGKPYVLRKNLSFSYIQPRSRANAPFVNPSVVEPRTANAVPSIILKHTNPPRVLSMSSLYSGADARYGSVLFGNSNGDNEKLVPFGGFSSPHVGDNILNHESIFEKSPWSITDYGKGNGGLRNAITFALEEHELKLVKWVGTVGMATDLLSPHLKQNIHEKLQNEYNSLAVFTDDFTFQGHYKNFCKLILWPTLHYQVPDDAKSKAFEDHSWKYYKAMNEAFADEIVKTYTPGDMIWVHDYHLFLVPSMLREKLGPTAKIGFFLHAAFPSSEVFRCLAQRKNLLQGMIGANAIGFQIPEYCRHFLQTCNRILLADVINNDVLLSDGKCINVYSLPIGIDATKLARQIDNPSVRHWKKLIEDRWQGKQLIVGRDKLDKLRGVRQKLLAYEIFLKRYPDFIGKTTFIQILLKSNNADAELESEIMLIVERINSLATDIMVSPPVVILNQDIDFQQYLALLCVADAFIVSTMREGMNLTCHEFIVAAEQKHSPLILSEFTGSASIFGEGALVINPWDFPQMAEEIHAALTMLLQEKQKRWLELHQVLASKSCYNWISLSLSHIEDAWKKQESRRTTRTISLNNSRFADVYLELNKTNSQGKRIFMLDFDAVSYGDKVLSAVVANRKLSVLSDLTSDPRNIVFIISYMEKSDLDLMYGRIPNIGLVSENGGYVKFPGLTTNWFSLVSGNHCLWMKEAVKVIDSLIERLPESYVEVEECTVRYHTEKVQDSERARQTIGECVSHFNDAFQEDHIHATVMKELVVIQSADLSLKMLLVIINYYNKGELDLDKLKPLSASTNSSPISQPDIELPSASGAVDLLIYISGSTAITEPVFEYCNNLKDIPHVFTVAAGQYSNTNAKAQVDGTNKLLSSLSQLI